MRGIDNGARGVVLFHVVVDNSICYRVYVYPVYLDRQYRRFDNGYSGKRCGNIGNGYEW